MRILLIVLLASCCAPFHSAGVNALKDSKTITTGMWGGEHILLEVSRNGGEVEFDCARGHITQPLALNGHGGFDLPGTFTPEHGGPVRRDEVPTPLRARYSGHVDGDSMTLTVTLEKDNVGTFTLGRGQPPNLRKCR
jgi:hypothetical protein